MPLVDALAALPRVSIYRERDLLMTKHFVYRFMSPLEATRQFALAYEKRFKRALRARGMNDLAERTGGVNWAEFMLRRNEFAHFWHARQRADALGLRYDHFVEFAFEFAENRGRERKALPRPNQLCANVKTEFAWNARFEAFIEKNGSNHLYGTDFPDQYRFEAYNGLPAQMAFREHAIERALKHPAGYRVGISIWCLQRRYVPIRSFPKKIYHDTLLEIMQDLKRDRIGEPAPTIGPIDLDPVVGLMQSCEGLPGTFDPSAPTCSACPRAANCQVVAAWIEKQLVKKHGSADPYGDRKKKMNRDRVNRHRAKRREAGAVNSPGPISS